MKILVTGSSGFIGKYVVREAAEQGHEVFGYDIVNGNSVLDRSNLIGKAEDREVDAIIHLAGLLGTHELWDQREAAIDVNIKGALNVADAAMEVDAKLVSIEQPHIWYNVYEATKLAARRMLTGLHYDRGLRVDFVTAHNAYGIGQAYGEGHPQKIIPTFATRAWLGEPIPIWGDGQQKVNLVWAGDVADMLLRRAVSDGSAPEAQFNAGSRKLHTVLHIAEGVRRYVGSLSKIEFKPMRLGEQPLPYPEPDRMYPYDVDWDAFYATVDSYKP